MKDWAVKQEPAFVLIVLAGVIAALSAANIGTLILEYGFGYDYAKGMVPLFRLNAEANLPTVFSFFLILTSSALCWLISRACARQHPVRSFAWAALSVIALFLAIDEGFTIHELLDTYPQWTEGLFEARGVLHGPWVVVYGAGVLVFILVFLPFFFSLPTKYKLIFSACVIIYVSGAIGLEMVGAAELDATGLETLYYEVVNSIEEMMEMSAVALAIYGLLRYLREEADEHG